MGNLFSSATPKEEKGQEELKVETGDQNAVKNFLDDMLLRYMQDEEYTIHYFWDNIKLLLNSFACVAAAVAHLSGIPFPEDRVLVSAMVAVFFFINFLLFLHMHFIENDCIATVAVKGKKNRVFYVRTKLPKYEDYYLIRLCFDKTAGSDFEQIYLGKLFDNEGYLSEEVYEKELKRIFKSFFSKKNQ